MNKKFNNSKTPIFQQSTDTKRFNEHFSETKRARKSEEKKPHFNDKKPYSRPIQTNFDEKNNRTLYKNAHKANHENKDSQISESVMRNAAGKENAVKVTFKNSSIPVEKVKKTGPLSPRAPEKIKKNRAEEMKIYGEHSCLALFTQRPESIVRAWATVEMSHKIGHIFSYLAANKKAYHVVSREEMELVSGTEHHGGICLLVKKQRPLTLTGYLSIPRQEDTLVLIDGVSNPQNLGGIIRTCAFYGMKNIVIDNAELLNSAAAMRVAEGGMEYIHTLQTQSSEAALQQLQAQGYQILYVTNRKDAISLAKVRFENKIVFVLSENINDTQEKQGTGINLSTTNPLKNGLNVAVNAGILLSKWYYR